MWCLAIVVVGLAICCVAAAAQGTADAGGGAVPSCASKLVTCRGYLNSTATPPASCCGPLKEAAVSETACMCSILMNKAALQAFGVKPEQGLGLAKRCGVTTDADTCAKYTDAGAGAATAGSTAASSANSAPAAAKPTANNGVTRHHLGFIGASSLLGFSFIWWTFMAY